MGVYSKKRTDGTTAWYYDFMHDRVRYRGIGGATKTQALRALEKRRSEVLSGEFGMVNKVGNPKIEQFAEVYLQRRQHLRSHKRDAVSVRALLKFFKGEFLMSIKASDIEDYIGKRRKEGVSNATINRELACLKKMYNLAIKWGEAKRNPVIDVEFLEEPPGRTRFLSEEEAQRLIQCSSNHIKPIVMTALNTGMRLGEILALRWEHVHIRNVIEPYLEVAQTKNNKKRFIPLNDDMVDLFISLEDNGSQYVFLGTRGERLTTISKPFISALKRAGIEDFRFHDLRHTFASHYIMNGGDLLALKEILGHSDLKMVQRYAHLASSHKRRQINNLKGKFTICHLFATGEEIAASG
ncbi:site-specific integrase [candidate division KSB1 bacterium]|nr:site-specific integrase [candidate division KSB1 bacterium]